MRRSGAVVTVAVLLGVAACGRSATTVSSGATGSEPPSTTPSSGSTQIAGSTMQITTTTIDAPTTSTTSTSISTTSTATKSTSTAKPSTTAPATVGARELCRAPACTTITAGDVQKARANFLRLGSTSYRIVVDVQSPADEGSYEMIVTNGLVGAVTTTEGSLNPSDEQTIEALFDRFEVALNSGGPPPKGLFEANAGFPVLAVFTDSAGLVAQYHISEYSRL